MDLGWIGTISFDMHFVMGFLSIVLIDLVLAGDNAVVIAMAVKNLHGKERRRGIIFGAGAAVLLRVVLTFFIAQLMTVSYVKLVGGALILWIAVKLLVAGAPEDESQKEAMNFLQAIKLIVIADITMSLDNMLAVAGASHGNLFLLIFGLGLSIPFVVLTSSLLSMLMDKYPIIVYIGAAILGKVGGEMLITDPAIEKWLHPSKTVEVAVMIFFTIAVVVVGRVLIRRTAAARKIAAAAAQAKYESR